MNVTNEFDRYYIVLVKGGERYIFVHDDEHRPDLLRTFGRFASDPELSFSWYDAACLSQRIRNLECAGK